MVGCWNLTVLTFCSGCRLYTICAPKIFLYNHIFYHVSYDILFKLFTRTNKTVYLLVFTLPYTAAIFSHTSIRVCVQFNKFSQSLELEHMDSCYSVREQFLFAPQERSRQTKLVSFAFISKDILRPKRWAIKASDKHYLHQSIVSGWHAFHNLYLILPGLLSTQLQRGSFQVHGR